MIDATKKLLTEYLGEKYHQISTNYGEVSKCSCGARGAIARMECWKNNRPFTTWADLGALKEKMAERGDWEEFLSFCFYEASCNSDFPMGMIDDEEMSGENKYYDEDFINYILNPLRFCDLAGEWVEEKENG